MMQKKYLMRLCIVLVVVFGIGCPSSLRYRQLENVAKDWCLTIRATQVIPVYPLTEDLQPGDVLLVRTPIEEQVAIYENKGFLPLDQLLVRLYSGLTKSNPYFDFYGGRYNISQETMPPSQWQAKSESSSNSWGNAPSVAFPSYGFSIKTGTGINLAIPIQGVPFALGLMNSGSASGSVTISKAHTYGLDNHHLEQSMRSWALVNRDILKQYEPSDGNKLHYLRVISRVYIADSMNVTLNNDEAISGEVGAGADRPLDLMKLKDGDTMENYKTTINSINTLMKDQLPGVKAKIGTASKRSVSLTEPFEKPLVIGYIGFDMPILKGGRLGAPISTLAQLNKTAVLPAGPAAGPQVYRLAAITHLAGALKVQAASGDARATVIMTKLNDLSKQIPEKYPFNAYQSSDGKSLEIMQGITIGSTIDRTRGFDAVLDYWGNADTSCELLKRFLDRATAEEKKKNAEYRADYDRCSTASGTVQSMLIKEPAVIEAVDYIFFGMTN